VNDRAVNLQWSSTGETFLHVETLATARIPHDAVLLQQLSRLSPTSTLDTLAARALFLTVSLANRWCQHCAAPTMSGAPAGGGQRCASCFVGLCKKHPKQDHGASQTVKQPPNKVSVVWLSGSQAEQRGDDAITAGAH
jgi:hypothetical protein